MYASEVPLIPRDMLFDNPERAAATISPDGSRLMWVAPMDGVLNIWLAARDDIASARPLTEDRHRGIRSAIWTYNPDIILYAQDRDGDENTHLYAVDLATGKTRDLAPFATARVLLMARSQKFPDEIVIAANHRDPEWHDIYRINIVNGERELLVQNNRFQAVIVDDELRPRFADEAADDGGSKYYQLVDDTWQHWLDVSAEDRLTTDLIGFDESGESVYMRDSRGRNTSALVMVDPQTKQQQVLASDSRVDVNSVLRHPTRKFIQAVSFFHDRRRWQVLDPSIESDLAYLENLTAGDFSITSRSIDDQFWVVSYVVDDGPARFYLYQRQNSTATFLFSNNESLESLSLAKMRSVFIKSRDDLELLAYYSLPVGSESDTPGVPTHPLPMVLTPHGGPWLRDYWGYHPWHQWLTNRGYAVLSVNFRASVGFGKDFVNAGNLQWGGKIIDDQQDAVDWAIRSGIADPSRIAVLGGSFGGFSVLAGMAFKPDLFACGVDLVGVSNLMTWLAAIPEYWKPMSEMLYARVGDPRTDAGRALLAKHSPINHADRICRPLLVGQGANDPRVRQAESEQIVNALQANGIPVVYVLYPDEGHVFARPHNRMSFYAMVEAFLAEHIGGRCEPLGDDFDGSSAQVLAGGEHIPGLQEAIAASTKK